MTYAALLLLPTFIKAKFHVFYSIDGTLLQCIKNCATYFQDWDIPVHACNSCTKLLVLVALLLYVGGCEREERAGKEKCNSCMIRIKKIQYCKMSKLHTKVVLVPAQHNTRHKANVRQTDERWKK